MPIKYKGSHDPQEVSLVDMGFELKTRKLSSGSLDVIIDIGLVVETIGSSNDEGRYYRDEQHKLLYAIDNSQNFYVMHITPDIRNRIKYFHATITETSTIIVEHTVGSWESQLESLAEMCRRKENIDGERKEKEEGRTV